MHLFHSRTPGSIYENPGICTYPNGRLVLQVELRGGARAAHREDHLYGGRAPLVAQCFSHLLGEFKSMHTQGVVARRLETDPWRNN